MKVCLDKSGHYTLWDHPFELTLVMKLGKELELNIEINTDTQTTGAFHTYLYYIDDIKDVNISGMGYEYKDALNQNKLFIDKSDIIKIYAEVDRIYTNPSAITKMIQDDSVLKIEHLNNSDIVLWNPYKDLVDMNQNEYKNMVCIETAKINKPFKHNDFMKLKIKS